MTTTTTSHRRTCPICYDDHNESNLLMPCGHDSCCVTCLRHWFTTEETTGQLAPTCPVDTCRKPVHETSSTAILGRAFVPAGSNNKKRKRDVVEEESAADEETKQWLNENTIECGGCQGRITKASGCDKVQCICGFRVCWRCRAVDARCSCNPGHGFVDNVTGLPSFSRSHQVATKEELKDMKSFLKKKQEERPNPFDLLMGGPPSLWGSTSPWTTNPSSLNNIFSPSSSLFPPHFGLDFASMNGGGSSPRIQRPNYPFIVGGGANPLMNPSLAHMGTAPTMGGRSFGMNNPGIGAAGIGGAGNIIPPHPFFDQYNTGPLPHIYNGPRYGRSGPTDEVRNQDRRTDDNDDLREAVRLSLQSLRQEKRARRQYKAEQQGDIQTAIQMSLRELHRAPPPPVPTVASLPGVVHNLIDHDKTSLRDLHQAPPAPPAAAASLPAIVHNLIDDDESDEEDDSNNDLGYHKALGRILNAGGQRKRKGTAKRDDDEDDHFLAALRRSLVYQSASVSTATIQQNVAGGGGGKTASDPVCLDVSSSNGSSDENEDDGILHVKPAASVPNKNMAEKNRNVDDTNAAGEATLEK